MKKRGDAVISINNFDLSTTDNGNYRLRDAPVGSDEVCTCPKPLLGTFHVCEQCWQSFYASLDNGVEAEARAVRERLSMYFDLSSSPLSGNPITEPITPKDSRPFRFFLAIRWILERPSVIFRDRFKPHFKNFVRHIWEKISGYHI